MIRWKYLLPRLVLVGLLIGVVCIGLSPAIRWSLILGGQQLTGARVEIDEVQASLSRTELSMKGIRFADPDRPLSNLFEIDDVLFDLDADALLRRKFVVHQGKLEGIHFHTGRRDDGTLESDESDEDGQGSVLVTAARERGEAWVRRSLDALKEDAENDLKSVQLARELSERWPDDVDQLKHDAKRIEQQTRQLRDQFKQIADRPLEQLHLIQPAIRQVDLVSRDALALRQRVQQLQKQVAVDHRAVLDAKAHDEQYLRERLRVPNLDGNELSDYLLGEVWSERLRTALAWIAWSREMIPESPPEPENSVRTRGRNVRFPGAPSSPDVLFRHLSLTGSGTVDEQPYSFKGHLNDWTFEPHRHPRPAQLTFEMVGSIKAQGAAQFDRRGQVAQDRFVIRVPAMRCSQQVLGDERKFAVLIEDGYLEIDADVNVVGPRVVGTIALRQPDLKMKSVGTSDLAGVIEPRHLDEALQSIRHMETRVILDGTLKRPGWKIESDLGPQLAVQMNHLVQKELVAQRDKLLRQANDRVDRELKRVQEQLVAEQQKLLKQLELEDQQLNQLRQQLVSAVGSPDELLSRGKQLFDRLKR